MRNLWKAVLSIVVVVIATVAILAAAFPVSKIRVSARNATDIYPYVPESYLCSVYIDGQKKTDTRIDSGQYIVVGTWQVKAGTHLVDVRWQLIDGNNSGMDGVRHASYEKVGAFSTKSLLIIMYR